MLMLLKPYMYSGQVHSWLENIHGKVGKLYADDVRTISVKKVSDYFLAVITNLELNIKWELLFDENSRLIRAREYKSGDLITTYTIYKEKYSFIIHHLDNGTDLIELPHERDCSKFYSVMSRNNVPDIADDINKSPEYYEEIYKAVITLVPWCYDWMLLRSGAKKA